MRLANRWVKLCKGEIPIVMQSLYRVTPSKDGRVMLRKPGFLSRSEVVNLIFIRKGEPIGSPFCFMIPVLLVLVLLKHLHWHIL